MSNFTASSEASLVLIDKWLAFQRYYEQLPSFSVELDQGFNTLFERGYGLVGMGERRAATHVTEVLETR
jgi:hypothetical protein